MDIDAPPELERRSPTRRLEAEPGLEEQLERFRALRETVRTAEEAKARSAIEAFRRALPSGALAPEVDALEVELACRTSADDAARALDAFKAERAGSHLVQRLEHICAPKIGSQTFPVPALHSDDCLA